LGKIWSWSEETRKNFKKISPRYRGGRSILRGYSRILVKDYPGTDCRGRVQEHVYLYEGTFGPVLFDKVLHHKNEVKIDSRPKNLETITLEENARLKQRNPDRIFKWSQESRENIRKLNRNHWLSYRKKYWPWLKDNEIIQSNRVWIYRPDHPRSRSRRSRCGYVLRAIINWEETNGRPVPSGWDVHHLDTNKLNDDPSNLEAKPSVVHARGITLEEMMRLLDDRRIYWEACDRILYQKLLKEANVRGKRIDAMLKSGMLPKEIDQIERKRFLEERPKGGSNEQRISAKACH